MKTTRRIVLIALLAAAGAAPAQDDGQTAGPFRPGWYVAPMVTYMMADTARCNVDDGPGFSAAFGHRGDFASLEIWGQFLSLSHAGCTYTVPAPTMTDPAARDTVVEPAGTVDLNGGGMGLLLGPFFEDRFLSRFFGIVGFGVLRREGHPQYAQGDTTIFGDAGLGYMQPFELFGLDTSIRTEVRYRYDVQQPPHPTAAEQDPPPAHSYQDLIINLGLQIALSPKPEPMPEAKAEPVAVVAMADADADGVPDDQDQCPDTPLGKATNDAGCEPEPVPPAEVTLDTAKAGDTVVLHGVNFETARSTLTTNAQTLLDAVAEKLVARAELRIEIGGHTDSRGADSYNQLLSEQRAQSVMTYLTERGVGAERLSAVGYGELQPTDTNETDEGRERNRRVELKILEGEAAAAPAETPAETPAEAPTETPSY